MQALLLVMSACRLSTGLLTAGLHLCLHVLAQLFQWPENHQRWTDDRNIGLWLLSPVPG